MASVSAARALPARRTRAEPSGPGCSVLRPRGPRAVDMPSQWSAAAVAATEGCGGGGSAGCSYYQNAKGAETHMIKSFSTDRIKDGHKVNLNIAKLQELWKTPQIQTIHIPKSITDASFLRHPDLTTGQKRYLRSIARIHNSSSLRTLVKRQYMLAFHRGTPNPGILALGGRLSSSPRQPSPCTAWRHQQERGDPLSAAAVAALAAPDMILNSLWRPGRSKDGLKTGYASKTRCKSLKIFRRPGRLFMLPDDAEPHTREEIKEDDVLNKCMQSMSIEEQGEHLMAT